MHRELILSVHYFWNR